MDYPALLRSAQTAINESITSNNSDRARVALADVSTVLEDLSRTRSGAISAEDQQQLVQVKFNLQQGELPQARETMQKIVAKYPRKSLLSRLNPFS